MNKISVQAADNIEGIMNTYGNMLLRLCLITLGNATDAEDAVQEILIKYLQKAPVFENAEHEKAWLIRVATNQCRDMLRFRNRHPMVNIEEINEFTGGASDSGILDALMTLPDKFRTVLVLHYVEGYSVREISHVVGKTPSAVKMRLQKGRKLLREAYGKE